MHGHRSGKRFNHYRVEIKVVVLYCSFVNGSEKIAYVQFSNQDPAFTSEKHYFTLLPVYNLKCYSILSCVSNKHFVFTRRKAEGSYNSIV